ncbi:HCP-like protein [Gigaspora margarita]|uniref:HCP-like protein n=1 Tax=Gigaspora margarita TaxID=4874 RepID=A0A8H3XIU6_GIGMA|nr:HCP-like protein [Gigaspora margarita]
MNDGSICYEDGIRINIIGCCYGKGCGFRKDECNAFKYYWLAASIDHFTRIFGDDYCYDEGIVVEMDKCKAGIRTL